VTDAVGDQLRAVKAAGGAKDCVSAKDAKNLKKRKLVTLVTRRSFRVTKGPNFRPSFSKALPDLTVDMLHSGAWKEAAFKSYNFNAYGQDIRGGLMHPLMKVRAEFRKILLQMGFEEMPTNQFVENSFWNFDTLFQPQSHPARDAHDTFFVADPAKALRVPEEYLERVKRMHEKGGACAGGRSLGYGGKAWDREEALKNVLRTHTTAVSSKMLHSLGEEYKRTGVFVPKKYFSIDRVFRNETLDATHLAEFHQVEFFIASEDMTLGDLIGLLETFFLRIGITKLRFKPAYNPYTEPSMEIFGWHPGLNHGKGSWTEVGNSGMFRPEMLGPMGLPDNVRVIAGGLSLERPTMIKYGIDNIRELFGHKVDLKKTKAAPIARFFAYENGQD
jgi:phenylalanyl-tRNA synthetase alpha chain